MAGWGSYAPGRVDCLMYGMPSSPAALTTAKPPEVRFSRLGRLLSEGLLLLVLALMVTPAGALSAGHSGVSGMLPDPVAHAGTLSTVQPAERILAPSGGGFGPSSHLIAHGLAGAPIAAGGTHVPLRVEPGAASSSDSALAATPSETSGASGGQVSMPSVGVEPRSAYVSPYSWSGINSTASAWVPPDPVIAVGPTYVMQVVNANYEFWTKDGSSSYGPYALTSFLPSGNSKLGDVQVLYDNMTQRWFMTVDDFTYGTVWICTSTSSDPTSSWYLLNLSVAPSGDYVDRPILGVSDYVLGVGGNVWTNGGSFVDAAWFVINKTMLENNAGYYWWIWTNPAYYAVHPVDDWTNAEAGTPGTQYFVSTNSGSTPFFLARETGGATASPPTLTEVNYAHAALTAPPDAIQPGTNAPYVSVALSGTQEMNAVWQNGLLWFDFDMGCTPVGDTQARSCVEYIEFSTTTNTILNDVTQDQAGFYVYYPAIATDWFGDAAVAVGYSSSSVYPSLTVMGRNYTYTSNADEFWYYARSGSAQDAYGTCTAAPSVCRYGDYFGAASDPSDPGLIWIEGEYEAPGAVWSTYISGVRVNPALVPAAFWNVSAAQTDVGHILMLNFTDQDTQCGAAQVRICSAVFPWQDGSSYSDLCDGNVPNWGGLHTWWNVWSPSHTYTATGNYTLGGPNSYIDTFGLNPCVINAAQYQGEASLPELQVHVHRDPVVGTPIASRYSLDVGQTVTFQDPPMYGGVQPAALYAWAQSSVNFGCAIVAGGISCTPTSPGTYTAFVDVKDSLGVYSSMVSSAAVTVYSAPTASLAWSPTSIDVGQTSTITATPTGGSGGNSYSWTQSSTNLGCAFANSVSAVCTPTTPGSYTASVVITDSNGGGSGTLTSGPLIVDGPVTTSVPSPSPASVDVGQPVTFSTTASGGSGSYASYAWTPSGAGLGCAASTTATISCTPTVAGAYTIAVTVTDTNGGRATATSASYTVYGLPTIAPPTANVTSADVGQAVTFTATASGGSGGFSYSWSGLPTGCSGGTGATVSCTVSAAGTASVTVSATDSNGVSTGASSALSFVVYVDPTATAPTATPTHVEVGQSVSFSTTASGGTGTYAYSWSGLPTGCTTSNTDPLSCTPTATGSFSVGVTVLDSNHFPVAPSILSFTVIAGPSVTTPTATPAAVDVGQTTSFSTTASGGSGGFTYVWSGLPTGCTGANAATTSCTPTAAGTFQVGLNVTDSSGGKAASGLLKFVVSVLPTVGKPTATPASVDVGQATTITATVTGGAGALTYLWTGLPAGCSSTSATLSCSPSAAGTSSITLKVTDANGGSGTSAALSLTVYALPTLTAPVATPDPVTVGASLSISTTVSGGAPSDAYAWTGLPTGCASANAASVSCTPTTAGTFSTKVTVTDGNGGTATSAATTITVNAVSSGGSPTVSVSANPASIALGATSTLTGLVSGGTTPYTYAWTGLPTGCTTANTASLSCKPSVAGTFTITLTVTDAQTKTGQGTATLTVTTSNAGAPTVTVSANPTTVPVQTATTLTGSVTGGTTPYTYAWTGLPTGCSSQNVATLTCTPTATGTFSITLTVTDGAGKTGQGSVSITVTRSGGGNNNQTTSPGGSLLSNPLLLLVLIVAVVAVVAAALLLRRKRSSSASAPAPSGAAEPAAAPPPPPGGPETPPPPPPS